MKKLIGIIVLMLFFCNQNLVWSNNNMLDLKGATMSFDGQTKWGAFAKYTGNKESSNGFVFGASGGVFSFDITDYFDEDMIINEQSVSEKFIKKESKFLFLPIYANADILIRSEAFV